MLTPPLSSEFLKGIEFLLSHLSEPIFPRTIMTCRTMYQRINQTRVDYKHEMLERFRESVGIDCRINAFPLLKPQYFKPDLIFIDLDLASFKSRKSLDRNLQRTLKNIVDYLQGVPTVLWTGHGYHIYQPLEAIESAKIEFQGFTNIGEQFLTFAPSFLSGNKNDKSHHPSFRSSLLRIPNSSNSKCIREKVDTKVKIIQEWNKVRPHMKLLLGSFHAYLVDKRNQMSRFRKSSTLSTSTQSIGWIESLLDKPIDDGRKLIINLVLIPYLCKVRHLPPEQSFHIIKEWLVKCESLKRFDRNIDRFVKDALDRATDYFPMRHDTLKTRNPDIYSKTI